MTRYEVIQVRLNEIRPGHLSVQGQRWQRVREDGRWNGEQALLDAASRQSALSLS